MYNYTKTDLISTITMTHSNAIIIATNISPTTNPTTSGIDLSLSDSSVEISTLVMLVSSNLHSQSTLRQTAHPDCR